jgi:hypothetical protein
VTCDRGQFPHRHLQPADDLAIVDATQCLALCFGGGAKAEMPGDLVERAENQSALSASVPSKSKTARSYRDMGSGLDVRVGSDVRSNDVVRHGDTRRLRTIRHDNRGVSRQTCLM